MAYSKIIGGMVVLGIITILIFSGPASAFIVSLDIRDPNVKKGDELNLELNIETGDNESPTDVDYILFKLIGASTRDCKFSYEGEVISGCNGIQIKKLSSPDTGYCKEYGYGYGCKLNFKIIVDTEFFDLGNYSTSLILVSKGQEDEIKGKDVSITIPPNRVCSIRANDGKLIVNNIQFENNKINFYIPHEKATRGEGYLTGQNGRERLLYRFKIEKILSDSKVKTQVRVSGKYRIGTFGKFIEETAILTFDKVENITTLTGPNIKMNAMKIGFREWC